MTSREDAEALARSRRLALMTDECEYEIEFDRAVNLILSPRFTGNRGFVSRKDIRDILHTLHTRFNLTLTQGEP